MSFHSPTPLRLLRAALLAAATCALSGPLRAEPGDAPTAAGPGEMTREAARYEHAEGVARDYTMAVRLYCEAARAGHGPAQYQLGWMYANARGVGRDDVLAALWFARAAAQGDAHAQRMLARLEAVEDDGASPCTLPDGTAMPDLLRSVPDPSRELIRQWVERLAPDYGLDSNLVLAVIQAESDFNPRALSAKDARGLMQLIPGTAERFGVADVWDPLDNIRGGMAYLRWLIDHFEGNVRLALAGYNAGEGAVARYRGIPPYPETRAYVKRVTRTLSALGARAGSRTG